MRLALAAGQGEVQHARAGDQGRPSELGVLHRRPPQQHAQSAERAGEAAHGDQPEEARGGRLVLAVLASLLLGAVARTRRRRVVVLPLVVALALAIARVSR